MGVNQSNNAIQSRERRSKPYVLPVIIPANKLHTSASFATINSDSSDTTSVDAKARESWYADREMLADLLTSYESKMVLGKGSSAQVFEVVHRTSREQFACKIVRKSFMNDERTMNTETEIMMRLKHQNLIQLHELYETQSSRWFIMELANAGTLQQALAAEVNYTEELIAGVFKQVLLGVKHLHDMGIVHRDLKQDNILCTIAESSTGEKHYIPKIADFGLSAIVGMNTYQDSVRMEKERKSFHKLKDMWGTKEYFAPEVYKKAYGPQVDVWSLGCVLYELLTGVVAFPTRERGTPLVEKYLLNNGKTPPRVYQSTPQWKELSDQAQDLLNMMLKINPKKRFSIQECLNHPFIRTVQPHATVCTTYDSYNKSSHSSNKVNLISIACVVDETLPARRSSVLTGARAAAVKNAELKDRRLQALAAQIEKDINQRQ